MDKRTFIKQAATLGLASVAPLETLGNWTSRFTQTQQLLSSDDDTYWQRIREGYRLKPDYINLENGYYCMQMFVQARSDLKP